MNALRPIRTDADLDAALARIEEIFDAAPGSPEDDELAILLDLVEFYEKKNYPISLPDPVSAIKFRMDQANLTPRDLIPFIGNRGQGIGGAFGPTAHHHGHGPGPAPTPGNPRRRLVARAGGQFARRHTGNGLLPLSPEGYGKGRVD